MIKRKIGIFLLFYLFLTNAAHLFAKESLYYIHQDHLNSSSIITDENGENIAAKVYYPYGLTRGNQGSLPTERKYTGQISDQNQTGLYYFNARYYNPSSALFTQADTQEGPNRYVYAANNPLKYVDPTGRQIEFTYYTEGLKGSPEISASYVSASTLSILGQRTDFTIDISSKHYDGTDLLFFNKGTYWSAAELEMLTNALDNLPPAFTNKGGAIYRQDKYNTSSIFEKFSNTTRAYSELEGDIDITFYNNTFDYSKLGFSSFQETIFHEYTHAMSDQYGSLDYDPFPESTDSNLKYAKLRAVSDFMTAAGYYYWNNNKKTYMPTSKDYCKMTSNYACSHFCEDMAEKGAEYGLNSQAFSEKHGPGLYDFYYKFFYGYTYDNYIATPPLLGPFPEKHNND